MKTKLNNLFHGIRNSRFSRLGTAAIIVVAIALLGVITARAVTILSVAGFADFSYGPLVQADPTDGRPESKLWFNDGLWWGNLYNPDAGAYQIYHLDWASQNWVSTNTATDVREESRADVLWDAATQKLYVVSHIKQENPTQTNNPLNFAWLYRYSYDSGTKTYSLDADFANPLTPVKVNEDKTRTAVLDKDSSGRLWVTYVSKAIGATDYKVYVNFTTTSGVDDEWDTAYALPFTEATVNTDAISSIVAFTDVGGSKIGVAWSNELDPLNRKFYFATRLNSSDPADPNSWSLDSAFTNAITVPANDHIDIVSAPNNQLFFSFKTEATDPSQPFIAALARDTDGTYYFHSVSLSNNDTRPIVVYDAGSAVPGDEYVYVFTVSNPAGGVVCFIRALVTSPLSAMSFSPQNCSETPGGATKVLADATLYTHISNVNSTRQVLDNTTDIVVIGADQSQTTYVHAVLNTKFPYVTSVQPAPDSVVPVHNPLIRAVFSEAMNGTTVVNNFTLANGAGPVAGSAVYSSGNHWVTFTPDADLVLGEIYTATLTADVTSAAGQPLLNVPYSWSFQTPAAPGAFDKTAPNDGATGQLLTPTLTWGSSTGAISYEYCYDTTDDDACSIWVDNGALTSVSLSGLTLNTTYYWHVRAVNGFGMTYSNVLSTAFWSFTTGDVPGAFNKTAPSDGATDQPLNPTLTWGNSTGATSYEYCYDTTDDDACTLYVGTGTTTSVGLSGLTLNTTYYWQVRAINGFGTVYSNGSSAAFWSFTTANLPGAFDKTAPADGASGQPLNPTLSWGSSAAASTYEYCYDTTDDDACSTWVDNGTLTSVSLSGLSENTNYFWHVRAINSQGTTYSNGSETGFWSFKTSVPPLNIYLPLISK